MAFNATLPRLPVVTLLPPRMLAPIVSRIVLVVPAPAPATARESPSPRVAPTAPPRANDETSAVELASTSTPPACALTVALLMYASIDWPPWVPMSFSVTEAPTASEPAGRPRSASLSANANPPASAATIDRSLAITEMPSRV